MMIGRRGNVSDEIVCSGRFPHEVTIIGKLSLHIYEGITIKTEEDFLREVGRAVEMMAMDIVTLVRQRGGLINPVEIDEGDEG